jgi:hypothetical protein
MAGSCRHPSATGDQAGAGGSSAQPAGANQAQHDKRSISISRNGEHSERMGQLSDGANGHVAALYSAN